MNVIVDRVAYFLKDFPPFQFLSSDEQLEVANSITVVHFKKSAMVFEEGKETNQEVYVLRKGNIRLLQQTNQGNQLVDQCEPGDVFGVRSVLTNQPYRMTALCEEESLVYAVPKKVFDHFLEVNSRFALFFTAGYAAGQAIVRSEQKQVKFTNSGWEDYPLQFSTDIISCFPENSIQEALQHMMEWKVGSILVTTPEGIPLGIVTDRDLRNKVLATGKAISEPVSCIMSAPVLTIAEGFTVGEVLVSMIRHHVHHLVITEDGTDQSPVKGIVSEHDLMVSQQNHPAAIVKGLSKANSIEKWNKYRDQADRLIDRYLADDVSVGVISNLVTEINDIIIKKVIESELAELPDNGAGLDFCWLSLGSEGREEQILRTDQDNALVFADNTTEAQKQTLLAFADRVNQKLIACGFEECPANIMARNPENFLSVAEWKDRFRNWIEQPTPKALMNATIFFDFRSVFGNEKLVQQLRDFLKVTIQSESIFLNYMAANAMQNPPPLSFFKNFVVEKEGDHKDTFDIKGRAMMPLSDAARLLCLQHGIYQVQNTQARFQQLIHKEPQKKELFQEAAQAYGLLMKYRARVGRRQQSSGRFVPVKELTKLERQILKNAFLPIKELQEMLEVRFKLAYFR